MLGQVKPPSTSGFHAQPDATPPSLLLCGLGLALCKYSLFSYSLSNAPIQQKLTYFINAALSFLHQRKRDAERSHGGAGGAAPRLPTQRGRGTQAGEAGVGRHLPDLFLYSMSNPVMMLLPSNRCVHRKFMLRAFTSRISSSGGSGGSWGDTSRLGMRGRKAAREQRDPHGEASRAGVVCG